MHALSRRTAATLFALLLVLSLLALARSSAVPAGTGLLPADAIAPTVEQKAVARQIGAILERQHYRQARIDDSMSVQIFKRYLESLDSQHAYLLADDIAEFSRYQTQFDDMIRTGQIEPAFLMFNRFQQRNRERLAKAIKLLAQEPDWQVDEYYEFDRKDVPWAQSGAELDELWRKRVKSDGLSLLLAGKTWAEASKTLTDRYSRTLKRVDQISADDVFENFMNAYARTYDPHSSYFSPRQSEEYRIAMALNYDGIGASLQLTDDYVTVINIIEGGPAATAGTLGVNDRITGVAQGADGPIQDVIGWRLDDVVQLIRGKRDTIVRLQLLPAGAAPGSNEKVISLTRNKITLEAQAAQKRVETLHRDGTDYRIGVITVPAFYQDVAAMQAGDPDYRSTTRDVRRLLRELRKEKMDGLILDLRGNGGGLLPEAQSLTGLFIDRGPVVQVQFSNGEREVLDDPESGVAYSGPLAVLVDRFSASASEIFAGAIQDYRRGVVMGQTTFGKGTVQNLVTLGRGGQSAASGQLTVTVGKFYRVSGESTQHRGVEPDIALSSPIDMQDFGESALDAALPWDRISPVSYQRATGVNRELPELAHMEDKRAANDPDYRWLQEDIAANRELRKQQRVSLNLAQRRNERDAEDAARLSRENARRESKGEPALKAVSDIEFDKLPDAVLDQAAQVMADMVRDNPTRPGTTRTAQSEQN
ncbi:MAG: carboxy terminal-processing peptidase [Steroidobacteraceae bacterium]